MALILFYREGHTQVIGSAFTIGHKLHAGN